VPFREAHEVVGKLVAHCVEKNLDLRGLGLEELRSFHKAFPAAARELTDLDSALEARSLAGGTARKTVLAALEATEARHAADAKRLGLPPEGTS